MIPELLVNNLNELVQAEFDRFKWFLRQGVDDYKKIPNARLEDAKSREALVSEMISTYEPGGAAKLTVLVLRKMNKNYNAGQLERDLEPVLGSGGVTGPLSSKAVTFVNMHEAKLIQKVSLVDPIADDLKPLIGDEKYAKIRAAVTPQDKMRVLYSFLSGSAIKERFYQSLLKNEEFLVKELDS
ncbi:apoptosis-associated speck-like protein containing a CARD isoform X2 [Brachyhypopomus gauderio]|uniref:apoptosis-associated speck-like protein containing a CARD isoform X2 n=1 Tax=Brachyhypopomus gauderio TaxID=698409 RepID=UPI00404110BF